MTKPYIVTMDEHGFYRLIKYDNVKHQYNEVVAKIEAETRMDAKLYFHYRHSIDINDIY